MANVLLKCNNVDGKSQQIFSKCHTKPRDQNSFMLTLLVNCGINVSHDTDGSEWKRHKFRVTPTGSKSTGATGAIYTGADLLELLCDTVALPEGADPVTPELPGKVWAVSSLTGPTPAATSTLDRGGSRSCVSDGTTARNVDSKVAKLRGGIFMCAKIRETLKALPEGYKKSAKAKKVLDDTTTPDGCWLQVTPVEGMVEFAKEVRRATPIASARACGRLQVHVLSCLLY